MSPDTTSTSSTPPSPCSPTTLTIAARWIGYGRYSWKRVGTPKTHVYRLATLPSCPIAEGSSIKLYATTRQGFYSLECKKTDTGLYDPHIQGAVTGIAHSENDPGRAIVTIVNECQQSTVHLVQLDVPCQPRVLIWPDVTCSTPIAHTYCNRRPFKLADPKSIDPSQWVNTCKGVHCVQSVHVVDARILFPYQRGVGRRTGQSLPEEQKDPPNSNDEWSDDSEEQEREESKKKRKATRRVFMSFSTMEQVPSSSSN